MVSQKLLEALNEQLNFEYLSAHYYLGMAAYFSNEGLDGFANFFMVQAEEERFHARKFYDYINEMDGRVTIASIDGVQNEFESAVDVFKVALHHEQIVTKRIYNLMDIAMEEREHATVSFLKWFIDEQVEEESGMKDKITKLERISDNSHALYMMDAELGARTFTPPAAE
ncbi:ferritin [Andreesenia angusta]|uniref:Ferritin n=1 Tax=Andreesenia angusta TaxID=39480 RepID=A0A1S1V8J1_9FIRM|nr:ferritin [Andreesenia angusta]OHW62467.1 ferritin [Andreesenia angusta]